ncbi:hypothetical protein OG216_34940 [Streptomycetaceae bacterium NBC_01309]
MRLAALTAAGAMVVTLTPAEAMAARTPARTTVELPDLQKETPVSGKDTAANFQQPVAPGTQIEYAPTRVTPIDGGQELIVLGSGDQAAARTAIPNIAPTSAGSMQQVAGLPLWVGPAQQPTAPLAARSATPDDALVAAGADQAAATADPAPAGTWTVTVPTRAETEAAGIDGVLMKLEPSPDASPVDLRLKYEQFEQLYGAGWGSRLRFVQFPACFLTTPELAGCSEATEVESVNNATANEVSATVAPAAEPAPQGAQSFAATASATGGAVVLAATGGKSGEAGDYQATSLQPSGKWTAGGSSGGFSWTYPVETPPVAAGPKPSVSLGYSSQSVDGRTSTTNNQASWVGDGWDYHPGFIERTYRGCADDKTNGNNTKNTGDLCWRGYNAVLSLEGSSTQLVPTWASAADRDAGKAPIKWTPANDNGTRVEQKFGAANGDNDGEHWVVTTANGTRYHFGLNRLPGWSDGKATSNSAFTVPVFGNQTGEPCRQTTFEASACDQAWRWNLDYVEDTHGNAMALYWNQEKNWYAQAGKSDAPKPYVRGGWLDRIEYGLRADSVYTKAAPAKISFAVDERCLRTSEFDCSDAKFTKHSTDGLHWPDVPVDSMCKDTGKCMVGGPTFWTRKWLTTITTQVATAPGAATYRPVDSYELKHNFLDARYDTNPPAWLDSIQRTGHAADGKILALPPVTFHANAVDMPNRQTGPGDNRPPFVRLRVEKIFTGSGGGIVVTYSQPDPVCSPGAAKPKPEENTSRCYPVYWAPDGADDPKVEWFNKYVVEKVSEEDYVSTPGEPAVVTQYRYLDGAAWAKDDNELAKPAERTWNQWRGYARVQVVTGRTDTSQGTVAGLLEQRFFRGMHGDPMPSGPPRTVKVKDSTGADIADDLPAFRSQVAETITYLGDGQPVAARQVTTPWARTTATQTRPELPDLQAYQSGVAATGKTEKISGSRERSTRSTVVSDPVYGLPTSTEDLGDTAVTGDEQCTVITYAHHTAANIVGAKVRVRTTAGLCADATSAGPDRIIGDSLTLYDNLPFEQAPTKGDVTSVQTITGSGASHTVTTATSYDVYGRVTKVTDADGRDTTTIYTPADNSTPTQVQVTNPLGHKTATAQETGRGSTLTATDANGKITRTDYDPLGRPVAVWTPSRQFDGATPNVRHTYDVSGSRVPVVTTETLRDNGTYAVAKSLYDGMLRPRQTQTEAVGAGRLVSDTFYNPSGGTRRTNTTYLATDDPSDVLYVPTSNTQIRTWTENTYDGLSRVTKAAQWYAGASAPERATTTTYAGDYTVVTPPPGGTAARTWTDILGRTVRLEQFTNATQTSFVTTTYAYDLRGDRTRVTDAAGNTWTWTYDARKQLVATTDPDKGASTSTYDNAGRQTSTTDARGTTLATTYDALGRKTALRSGDANGPVLAEWTYDALPGALGQPVASSRYANGNAYTSAITGYDSDYRPLGTTVTIPAAEGSLAGTYTTTQTYSPTGKLTATNLPAAGGLPAEKVVTRYNADDLPISTSGQSWYASDTVYSPYGEVLRTQSGTAPTRVWTTNTYDEHTGQLLVAATHREAGPHAVAESRYGYDKADNVTYINNRTPNAAGALTDDVQCFNYDQLRRLVDAWTSANHCASGPKTGAGATVGGPDPYWTTYSLDNVGNRTAETIHDPAGNTANDATRTYTYPKTAGGNTHQVTTVTGSGPAAPPTSSYTYDADGNTLTRTMGGTTRTHTWNAEGQLERVADPGTTSSYVYDASGNRLIGKTTTGGTTKATLYLGATEVTATGTSVAADRYYTHPGAPTAVRRTGTAVSFLVADHHGTATTAISTAASMTVQQRKATAYGQPRGTAPAAWPSTRGFIGGTNDTTGLTHLGAREYDPGLGRFISVDPIMDLADPQQMHGYAYASNNPTTKSDPTGLREYDAHANDTGSFGHPMGNALGSVPTSPGEEDSDDNDQGGAAVQSGAAAAAAGAGAKGGFDWRRLWRPRHDTAVIAATAWLKARNPGYEVTNEVGIPGGSSKKNGKYGYADIIVWGETRVWIYEVKNGGGAAEASAPAQLEHYQLKLAEYLAAIGDRRTVHIGNQKMPPVIVPNMDVFSEALQVRSGKANGVIIYEAQQGKIPHLPKPGPVPVTAPVPLTGLQPAGLKNRPLWQPPGAPALPRGAAIPQIPHGGQGLPSFNLPNLPIPQLDPNYWKTAGMGGAAGLFFLLSPLAN